MIVAQILGALAVITCLTSFQLKTRKNILIVNLTSRIFYILQYIFLRAYEGAVFDFIGLIASLISKDKDKPFIAKYYKWFAGAVILTIIIIEVKLYVNVYSLFALLAIILEVIALFMTKEKHIRVVSLSALPFWLFYNIKSMAYGSAIGCVLAMISIITAIIRLDIKRGKIGEKNAKFM